MWIPFGATNIGNGANAAAEPAEAAVPTGPAADAPKDATES